MGTKFLRLAHVMARTGLKRSTIYSHIKDGQFPRQVNLGVRSVAWVESEIDEWMSQRIELRDKTR